MSITEQGRLNISKSSSYIRWSRTYLTQFLHQFKFAMNRGNAFRKG